MQQQAAQQSQAHMQPPVRATGFYQNENGVYMPTYPPDALLSYQLAQGNQPTPSPPPQGPSQSQQQTPQQMPATWYPPMVPYPYGYPQVPPPQAQMPAGAQPPMPYPMPGMWPPAPLAHPSAYMGQPPVQAQSGAASQATPPPLVVPSASASTVNTSSSFGAPYAPPTVLPTYPLDQPVAPRHAMMNQNNRRHSRFQGHQNRHTSNRFSRAGYPMEQSQSFVDPGTQRQSQHAAPVRVSGSFPTHLGSGTSG